MSKSTQVISKLTCVSRILEVQRLIQHTNDVRILRQKLFEPHHNLESFIKNYINISEIEILDASNTELEKIISSPFFRWSVFEDYKIKD